MSDDGAPADLTDVYNILVDIHDIMAEILTLSKARKAAQPSNVASDADLDGQYGDEKIKSKPRDWTGDFTSLQRMSESDPAMLDMLAERFDYFAAKDEAAGTLTDSGKPKAQYGRTSAKRARGWAARLRAGWKPKPSPQVKASEVKW